MVTAVIAGCVAITVAYLTQFVSENYKRHREGAALAAAIAGELASYQPAWPMLNGLLAQWIGLIEEGNRQSIPFRPFERPKDIVIDEMVPKLGLLGPKHVESVITVYANLRAFRVGLELITKEHAAMTDTELRARCQSLVGSLRRAVRAGELLVPELRARADQPFVSELRMRSSYIVGSAVVLSALLVWFGATIVRVENQRYALSLGMCQSDPLKVLAKAECLKSIETRTGWWWHLGYALRGN
jgi:hypothetical protein